MLNLATFELASKDDGIGTYEKQVKTPLPEETGGGYRTEENVHTAYSVGEYIISTKKVSDNEWSVWQYIEGDSSTVPLIDERVGAHLNAQQANRLAKQRAIEVSE